MFVERPRACPSLCSGTAPWANLCRPSRAMADFLIGAHAAVSGYKLLTLDAGLYRASFPELVTVTV